MMTHSMRERLSEKNGSRKTIFGVLSNKKYEVRRKYSYTSYRTRQEVVHKNNTSSTDMYSYTCVHVYSYSYIGLLAVESFMPGADSAAGTLIPWYRYVLCT